MNTQHRKLFLAFGLIGATLFTPASGQEARKSKSEPLTIQEQGSFAVGGKVTTNPGTFNPKQPTPQGQTLHGDHAYVFYQIPVNRRKLPLVFLHGTGQFSKTWETTPDGREGFQTIFLRRRFPVYLIDQPRRGNAGRSTVPATIDGVVSYKGIPFAAPPVGDLRWRLPQPVAPWTGVRQAAEFGADCMQGRFGPPPAPGASPGRVPSEDCLFLNVWSPASAAPGAKSLRSKCT